MTLTFIRQLATTLGDLKDQPGIDEPTRIRCAAAIDKVILRESSLFAGKNGKRDEFWQLAKITVKDVPYER